MGKDDEGGRGRKMKESGEGKMKEGRRAGKGR